MRVQVVASSPPLVRGEVEVGALLDALTAAPRGEPYGDAALALCGDVARRLLDDPRARRHPSLTALGFFARPAELARLRRELAAQVPPDVVRVPHGLVFHVPPATVDTVFVSSWLWATLAGNASIVRLSARASPVVALLCELVADALAASGPGVAPSAFVRYQHDAAITAAISARCALRVIWGGDATIATIRAAPLPPTARELTFADRRGMVALVAAAVVALDDAGLRALAEAMATDLFELDQRACSSPRLALWLGDAAACAAARERLWPAVAAVADARGVGPPPAVRLAREAFVHRAILDGPIVGRADFGPALTVLAVDRLPVALDDHPGGGLLLEATAPWLDVLERWISRKDQTLAHFGIPRDELAGLVARLAGRGLDRVVPVGRALAHGRFWDGDDLATAFVRCVHLVDR